MAHSPEYRIRAASSDEDLRQILALQAANLPEALEPGEREEQGFVTLVHDLPLLRAMNTPWPHIIATEEGRDEVVAYALVMLHAMRSRLPALGPMFDRLGRLDYRGRPLGGYRSYIMGQVCVARAHRGRGLVGRLYDEHRARMSPHFDLMITEIDRANPRSMRAHEKAGFEVIDEYRSDGGNEWLIVALALRAGAGETH